MTGGATIGDGTAIDGAAVAARVGGTRFTDVRAFAELDSTNRYLLDEARAGAPEGVVAVAEHQTAGRGRLGRTWSAPAGASLLVSVLLRPELAPADAALVTVATSLAIRDAVGAVAGVAAGVKWPNDLVVGDRKLVGILAEVIVAGGALAVVVGAGINVNWHAFPAEIAATATACNIEAHRTVDRAELLVAVLAELEARYAPLPAGRADLLDDYRAACVTLGRAVRVEMPAGTLTGRAVDVDAQGRLVVEHAAGRETVAVGEVVHVRPA
jgi:BirA family biotin operon repressor/biotin-[acetyl-CoA-carboxylase] ligase